MQGSQNITVIKACELDEEDSSSCEDQKHKSVLTKGVCIMNPQIERIKQNSLENTSKKNSAQSKRSQSSKDVKVFGQESGNLLSEEQKSELIGQYDSQISEFFERAENSDYNSSSQSDTSFTSVNEKDDIGGGVSKVFQSSEIKNQRFLSSNRIQEKENNKKHYSDVRKQETDSDLSKLDVRNESSSNKKVFNWAASNFQEQISDSD